MNTFFFIVIVCCGMLGAYLGKKLTLAASLTGGILAVVIFFGVGWPGIFLMAAFFLLATRATSWKKEYKRKLGVAQESKRGRDALQVLANGGVAGIAGLLAIVFPHQSSFLLFVISAAFSSATADTVSSELGTVYGKIFYDVLNFKMGERGRDGVISIEGILCGVAGSGIIAAVYALTSDWNLNFLWIVAAGTTGNIADSYLGATLERKGVLGNNGVNFLNTAVAALLAMVLYKN